VIFKHQVILPPSTIGIIGGGQLGRMLAIAAKQMGYQIAVLDPVEKGPCSKICDFEINAPYDDLSALKRLSEISDVITYEFENIPATILLLLQDLAYIPQGYRPLLISQNRDIEKKMLNEHGFKTARFYRVHTQKQLLDAIHLLKYPCCLKTTTGGYDGKGQVVIQDENDLPKAHLLLNHPCILEEFVLFKKEISVVVMRSTNDEIKVFPISENIHRNHILHQSIVPARIHPSVEKKVNELAVSLITKLDFVGTIAIEMFLLEDDEILINEIAPRVHNSGHYTIEACETSQFEQHIRAICGLKLNRTNLRQNAVMVNILGKDLPLALDCLKNVDCKVHLYGKTKIETNRKMGHVTFLGSNQEILIKQVQELFGS